MDDLNSITTFLGWCTLINIGMLTYSTVMLMVFREPVKRIHSKLFGISQESLDTLYFNFLGNYKLAIFIFNLVPYCALRIMA